MTDRVRELNRKLADDIKALQNQYLIDSGEWKLNSTIIVKKHGKEYCRCKVTNILFRNESVTVTLNRIKPDGTLNYNQFDYYKYGYTFEENGTLNYNQFDYYKYGYTFEEILP